MNKVHLYLLISFISIFEFFIVSNTLYAQDTAIKNKAFEQVKTSVLLLDDGQKKSYGIYLASDRNNKFMYVLSSNQLNIGGDNTISGSIISEKIKKLKVTEVFNNDSLRTAIYKIKSSLKRISPFVRIPKDSLNQNDILYVLGKPINPENLTEYKVTAISEEDKNIRVIGDIEKSHLGSPVFDHQGRIVGALTRIQNFVRETKELNKNEQFELVTITELLKFATHVLSGVDLYPIWKEIYPAQPIINTVNESVPLLLTKNGGAGIFLGRDKSNFGYILTAFHVVANNIATEDTFSVCFFEKDESHILGETLIEKIDKDLDLAIVKVFNPLDSVVNCPYVKPAIFIRSKDLENLQNLDPFPSLKVASIGYQTTDTWREKFGSLKQIIEEKITSDLPLETQDSGGPIFNEQGEIIGLNRKIELSADQTTVQSFSVNSLTILNYLNDRTADIGFKEKWGFHKYPSWWSKNKSWLMPIGAGVASALGFTIYDLATTEKVPPENLASHPDFVSVNPR